MNLPISISNKNVMIAGAGGGFDVFAGLPIGLELLRSNNRVVFCNYSFTDLPRVQNATWITEGCLKVSAESTLNDSSYFPEKYLAEWLKNQGCDSSDVY